MFNLRHDVIDHTYFKISYTIFKKLIPPVIKTKLKQYKVNLITKKTKTSFNYFLNSLPE